MFKKARLIIDSCIKNVQSNLLKRSPIKWLVFSYFFMVAMLVTTYYVAWLFQWDNGKVVMSDLLSLIKEMVGASMVAFITFIATCFIDKDQDNIPDCFEKEIEKK